MADFNVGQTFIDHRSIAKEHTTPKAKYFIGMNYAYKLSDIIACFVMNTERRMDLHSINCNRRVQKFVLCPDTFSFLNNFTSIMLNQAIPYTLEEIYKYHSTTRIELFERADDNLCRQIKNCIDFSYIEPNLAKLIKDSFKNLS